MQWEEYHQRAEEPSGPQPGQSANKEQKKNLATLGQANKQGLVGGEALDVGILGLGRSIAAAVVNSNANAQGRLARDFGSLNVGMTNGK